MTKMKGLLLPGLFFIAQGARAALPELPRVFLDTNYPLINGTSCAASTTAQFSGCLTTMAGANPNLNHEIVLTAGNTFTGPFTLPARAAGTGWIVIRSNALASLPAAGTRVSPNDAGNMPVVLATNVGGGNAMPGIEAGPGARNYRLVGLEVRPASGAQTYGVIFLGSGNDTSLSATPIDIVVDRCYVHGLDNLPGRRGIALNGRSLSVIDSYVSNWKEDFADSQAVMGWNGAGPFKIVNNFLEGAGENVMFGGADPRILNLVPSDMEIRRNHFTKRTSWRSQAWDVKNLFELKIARRALVEGNIFEQNWDDAQVGFAFLLTVRNQDGTAPWSAVQDITVRRNIIRQVANGINISAADDLETSQQTQRVLIEDNLIENVLASWGPFNRALQFLTQPTAGIADLTVRHNTIVKNGLLGFSGDSTNAAARHTGFIMQNNIGEGDFTGSGASNGNLTLSMYYASPTASPGNVLVGSSPGSWSDHPGNFFPSGASGVGFVDYSAGNYRLAAGSAYRNAGTDGRDPGADIDALNAATSGSVSGSWGPPDTTPPTVSITAPSNGATVSGAAVTISANASDNVGVAGVQFRLDGADLGTEDTSSPYSIAWNTTLAPNGSHALTAVTRDSAGNQTMSAAVNVTVSNIPDTAPPSAPTGLSASAVSSSQINLSWTASTDNVGVTGYRVYRGGVQIASTTVTSYQNTGLSPQTTYTYTVSAFDAVGNVSAQSASASALTPAQSPNILAAYSFDEGSGSALLDRSGNGNNGALSGAAWITQGQYSGAASFSGNQYITIPDNSSLNVTFNFTLTLWLRRASISGAWEALYHNGTTSGSWGIYINPSGSLLFSEFGVNDLPASSGITDTSWHHVACVKNGDAGANVTFYLDGVSVGSLSAGTTAAGGDKQIAGDNWFNSDFFNGSMDNLRLHDRALTLSEIQNDMNTPIGGPPPPSVTSAPAKPRGLRLQ